jgi:hypothetical protein
MLISLPHKTLIEVVVGQIFFHKNYEQPVKKLGSDWANKGKLRLSGALIRKRAKISLINRTLLP